MTARTPWCPAYGAREPPDHPVAQRRPEALSGCSTPAHDLLNLARDGWGVSIAHLRETQRPGRTLALPQWTGDLGVRNRVLRSARRDLDLVAVALVAGAIYVAHGYSGLLSRDLGVCTYGGEHVARGTRRTSASSTPSARSPISCPAWRSGWDIRPDSTPSSPPGCCSPCCRWRAA
jgi:hypothetical protein